MTGLPAAAQPPPRRRCALVPIEKPVPLPVLVYITRVGVLTHARACGRAARAQCTGAAG